MLHFDKKTCKCCGNTKGGGVMLSGVMGRILPIDVGKQIYETSKGVYQVENQEQLTKRLKGVNHGKQN